MRTLRQTHGKFLLLPRPPGSPLRENRRPVGVAFPEPFRADNMLFHTDPSIRPS